MFKGAGFKIIETFGDYYMNPYNLNSNRLILLAKKINT
jgi:ribosomal protein S18 acetylase RimI-like enzyme